MPSAEMAEMTLRNRLQLQTVAGPTTATEDVLALNGSCNKGFTRCKASAAAAMLPTLSTAPFHISPSNARQLLASTEQRSCSTALAGVPGWMSQLFTACPGATDAQLAAIRPSNMFRSSCTAWAAGGRALGVSCCWLCLCGVQSHTSVQRANAVTKYSLKLSMQELGQQLTPAVVVSVKPDTTTRTADCTVPRATACSGAWDRLNNQDW